MSSKSNNSLFFSVKVGKSYKNGGWAVKREESMALIPKLTYEDECEIVVEGIHSKAKLNIVPRIFFNKKGNLPKYLKKLHDEGKDRVDVEFLLNHDFDSQKDELNIAHLKINNLINIINDKDSKLSELQEKYEEYKDNIDTFEFREFEHTIEHLKSLNSKKDDAIKSLEAENIRLSSMVQSTNSKLDKLFDTLVQLENENEELLKKRLFYENECRKLNDKLIKIHDILEE